MEYIDLAGTYQENKNDLLDTIMQIESGTGTSHLCNSPATLVDLSFNDLFYPNPQSVVTTEQMREVVFRNAVMQPITIDPQEVKPQKRRNVRISSEPQSVAARLRRERISERMRILQRMVPGGTKMDTASMLEEAIQYVKFLKRQVLELERVTALTDQRASSFFSGGINI